MTATESEFQTIDDESVLNGLTLISYFVRPTHREYDRISSVVGDLMGIDFCEYYETGPFRTRNKSLNSRGKMVLNKSNPSAVTALNTFYDIIYEEFRKVYKHVGDFRFIFSDKHSRESRIGMIEAAKEVGLAYEEEDYQTASVEDPMQKWVASWYAEAAERSLKRLGYQDFTYETGYQDVSWEDVEWDRTASRAEGGEIARLLVSCEDEPIGKIAVDYRGAFTLPGKDKHMGGTVPSLTVQLLEEAGYRIFLEEVSEDHLEKFKKSFEL